MFCLPRRPSTSGRPYDASFTRLYRRSSSDRDSDVAFDELIRILEASGPTFARV